MTSLHRSLALAVFALALAPSTFVAAATPTPKPAVVRMPRYPNKALHTEFTVDVNAKGQVVRAKTVKPSHWASFDAQTYGNVLQMWVRHPDGSAQVGVYRVTYDYNPKTQRVHRGVTLIKAGGNWGNAQGAADQMIDIANKEARPQKLPPLDQIIGSPSPHP